MTLEQMKARIKAIRNEISGLKEKTDRTNEDVQKINELHNEFTELNASIQAEEALAAFDNFDNTVVPQTLPGQTTTQTQATISEREERTFGFSNQAEFLQKVIKAGQTKNREVDERLFKYDNTASTKSGEDGAFLIPTEFIGNIKEKVESDESLLGKTDMYNTGRSRLELPVSETAAWDSNGIQAYWEDEGDLHQDSKETFGTVDLKLKPLAAMVKLTEDLMEDAPALSGFVSKKAPEAMFAKINSAIVDGDGSGKPIGFLRSGFAKVVNKEAGQAAGSLLFENIVNMWSACLPSSRPSAIWLYNAGVESELRKLKFDDGAASPVPAFLPPGGLSSSPYGTLMGRPAMPMMGAMKELGKKGDIALVDLSYYITAMKGGIKQDVSTHVYFDTSKVALKFRMRIDGKCPFKSPVKAENGTHEASAFVLLEDR